MKQSTFDAAMLALSLDRTSREPLAQQLVQGLRRLILSGGVPSGARLPASRALAEELSLSRSTVVAAFDQLVAEGYADGRRGSGLYVAANLPENAPSPPALPGPRRPLPAPAPVAPFQPAAPDLALFPHADWARLLDRVWRAPSADLLAHPDPCGYGPLRTALCEHLRVWRGVACGPDQVVITSGLAEAVAVLAVSALSPGDAVLMEDPGYAALRAALGRNGLRPCPAPVDAAGFDIRAGLALAPQARAAVVTPSRHYPLGMTMPLARRMNLLDWARRSGGLVIEDDYDSEYRFEGQPLPAMTSLDGDRVVYVGSFSKVLFPSLRLSFMVVPPRLAWRAAGAMAAAGPQASLVAQPALARFIETGAFAAHLRRMRRTYARRQRFLVQELRARLEGVLEAVPAASGMHLVAHLAPELARRVDDREASRRARAAGIVAPAVSSFSARAPVRPGLLLGFAGFDETRLSEAVGRLRQALG